MDALEPSISAETLSFHYDKHHRGYIDKLNKQVQGTRFENMSLNQIVTNARASTDSDIFNNAAQAWNHDFLWKSMSPKGGGNPRRSLKLLLDGAYKNTDNFKAEFRKSALSQFGSGWAWLVLEGGKPRVLSTSNAESPVGSDSIPLLVLDVWEHAYYIDYRNDRAKYVDEFLDNLVNWDFAEKNLDAQKRAA
jgi:Fe-Mn family superoxide dismutase